MLTMKHYASFATSSARRTAQPRWRSTPLCKYSCENLTTVETKVYTLHFTHCNGFYCSLNYLYNIYIFRKSIIYLTDYLLRCAFSGLVVSTSSGCNAVVWGNYSFGGWKLAIFPFCRVPLLTTTCQFSEFYCVTFPMLDAELSCKGYGKN